MFDFNGKKILLTHTLIAEYMGSTVVCAQVAHALQDMGAEVTVISASFAYPAEELFDGVDVVIEGTQDIDIYSYDYVWVHSQLLPTSCISQLDDASKSGIPDEKTLPVFIFNHMSSLDIAPDEHPYIPWFEELLADERVFVSEEALDRSKNLYADGDIISTANGEVGVIGADNITDIPSVVICNPAPVSFCKRRTRNEDTLRKLAIVSNHVPEEVSWAAKMLEDVMNVQVDIIGIEGTPRNVDFDMLDEYDAVMSIGKTVQYCLVSGTPVFVYDHFGGWGYINDENIEKASYAHFAGRGGKTMSADDIVRQLVHKYPEAAAWAQDHVEAMRDEYGMEQALLRIFEQAPMSGKSYIGRTYDGYWKQIEYQMRFAWRYYRAWDFEIWQKGERVRLESFVEELVRENDDKEHEISQHIVTIGELESEKVELESNIVDLRTRLYAANDELDNVTRELASVYDSWSFKVGFALMTPARWVKRVACKLLGK